MRSLFTAFALLAALLAGPLTGAAKADEAAIRSVIDGQIRAFQAGDPEMAFTFAAPGIRQMFGDPQTFGTMVEQGYPMVWRPGSVEFLETQDNGTTWRQDVLITDAEGRLYKLAYLMIETPEGWKIAAVQILDEPEVGV